MMVHIKAQAFKFSDFSEARRLQPQYKIFVTIFINTVIYCRRIFNRPHLFIENRNLFRAKVNTLYKNNLETI